MAKKISITRYPNNEVRVVVHPVSLKAVSNETQDETAQKPVQADTLTLTLSQNSKGSGSGSVPEAPLKPGHGAAGKVPGYTQNARRRILRAGGAIDSVVSDPSDCLFLTGTLPGSSEDAKRAIAEWSAYAINLVQAWLSLRIKNKLLIYAWEFQKRGALHLHLTVVCEDPSVKDYILRKWKSQWTRVIDAISEKSGIDCWERYDGYSYANGRKDILQTDAQVCRSSAAAYLSKYMSKRNLQPEQKYEWRHHPSRYWGISRPLCLLIDSLTERESVEVETESEAQALYEDLLSIASSSEGKTYTYRHEVSQSQVIVNYSKKEESRCLLEEMMARVKESQSCYTESSLKGVCGLLTSTARSIQTLIYQTLGNGLHVDAAKSYSQLMKAITCIRTCIYTSEIRVMMNAWQSIVSLINTLCNGVARTLVHVVIERNLEKLERLINERIAQEKESAAA